MFKISADLSPALTGSSFFGFVYFLLFSFRDGQKVKKSVNWHLCIWFPAPRYDYSTLSILNHTTVAPFGSLETSLIVHLKNE